VMLRMMEENNNSSIPRTLIFLVKAPFDFIKVIYSYRSMIKAMAFQVIRNQYAGTFGGFLWSVINPLMLILIYWFVFTGIFRAQTAEDVPFVVVFCCGFIPWMAFSEILMTSTNAITSNSHLVTKTVFPTEILPMVNIVAGLITHVIMLLIFFALMVFNHVPFSLFNFQFIYYTFAMIVFVLGLGWFMSSLHVFFRDIAQTLGVILNVWFWLTPIVWNVTMVPQKYQFLIRLNPMYYIIEGYKSSFLYHEVFWKNHKLGIYYWIIALLVFILGGLVFRKLKPEFPEVL